MTTYYDVENDGNVNEYDFHQFGVGEVEAASDAELMDRETKGEHQYMGCLRIGGCG